MDCNHCGSPDTAEERCTSGPHYAKLMCRACGITVKFLPHPRRPLAAYALPAGVPEGGPLPPLLGTEAQARFAASVRPRMLAQLSSALTPDQLAAVRSIDDAGWWLSHRDKPLDRFHWPRTWPLAAEGVTP
jgi:hypothetical protein